MLTAGVCGVCAGGDVEVGTVSGLEPSLCWGQGGVASHPACDGASPLMALLSFPCSGAGEEQRLLALVGRLEQELGHLKADLSSWQHGQASCEKVDAIHEKVSASVFMFCHGK